MKIKLLNIGHTYAGMSVDHQVGVFKVMSDGIGSHVEARTLETEDPEAAATEMIVQANLLGLTDQLPAENVSLLTEWLEGKLNDAR